MERNIGVMEVRWTMNKPRRTNQTKQDRKDTLAAMLCDPAIGASTAHRLANLEGISPAYARRLLGELVREGEIEYRVEPHRPGWTRKVYYHPKAAQGGGRRRRRSIVINGERLVW